jgi:four helix bundle protein
MKIEKFEDLQAWQFARELTQGIYKTTNRKEFSRDYGLRDQIQRAAVSIMANIAEGFDSQSNQTFVQYLNYALRSTTEVQSHLYVALDQAYISEESFKQLYQHSEKIKRTIIGLIRYLSENPRKRWNFQL